MANKSYFLQNSKKGILIQARMSSSRFNGKMLQSLGGIPLVEYVYKRCSQSSKSDLIAVLTSTDETDDRLYEYCVLKNIPVFRGDLNNVLNRYIEGAKKYKCDLICRVCGDSPFVDVEWMDRMFEMAEIEGYDYVTFGPLLGGFLSEVMSLPALLRVAEKAKADYELEHVTAYMRKHLSDFNCKIIEAAPSNNTEVFSGIHLTIDYPYDLELANSLVQAGILDFNFKSSDVTDVLKKCVVPDKYRRKKE